MKKVTSILFIMSVLFLSTTVHAQPKKKTIPGYDVLGLAMYCSEFLAAPKLPGLSTLLNTFGDPLPCVEKRIKRGGMESIQIDLIDATCWRNNACPPGVPRPDDFKEIRKRAGEVSVLATKYPDIEWWVSPALEHDVKDQAVVSKMMKAAKRGCPTCKTINSPFSGALVSGIPLERHGTKVRAFSVSGDGASLFDADTLWSDCPKKTAEENKCEPFQHQQSGEYSTFGWFNELNLRCTGEETFTPPLLRTNKPTAEQFRQAFLVMGREEERPLPPKQCKVVREIRMGKEINKPNAEKYCNGQPNQNDSRGNKQLLIIQKPGKVGDRLSVINSSGKKVAEVCYYGPFDQLPGTYRWYMGNCSGQSPSELYDAFGGEWGFLQLGGNECLQFNAIRRQGTYR